MGRATTRRSTPCSAYKRALADGADALECDVRLTKDGHLVCVHDRRIDRTSNGRGIVSTLELAELAELDWGSWRDSWEDLEDPEIPDRDRSQILTLRRLLRGRGRRSTTGSRWRSRPSTRRGTPGWSSAASSPCSTSSAGPAPAHRSG